MDNGIPTVTLPNNGSVKAVQDLYFPRLQVNKHGEIVLSTGKKNGLTTGILVGYLPNSPTFGKFHLGQKFDDWEVSGELTDYDGTITIQLENAKKST